MSYSAVQGQPIFVDLLAVADDTGWSIDGNTATHVSCNAGKLRFIRGGTTPGMIYTVTFQVLSISGGILTPVIGGTAGSNITTPGFYQITLTATTTDSWFYSDCDCAIADFYIVPQESIISQFQQNTIAFSELTDKWGAWYTKVPDIGGSLFENTYEFDRGVMYVSEHNSESRGNFFGVQYPATIFLTTNQQPSLAKTFNSINYQSNMLLVSPSLIATSLGQASTLEAVDFEQVQYNDGSIGYTSEGLYQAYFLRDMNIDLVNGDPLKGSWLSIGLQTASPSNVLNLFSSEIIYVHSYQNIR